MQNSNCYENQKLRAILRKYDAILEHGGCCSLCGYDKNMSALEFHHKNPAIKKFKLDSRGFSNTNVYDLKNELDKCQLLCSNCHREVHNESLDMKNIHGIIENINKKTLSTPKFNKFCENCATGMKATSGKRFCSVNCRNAQKNYPSKDELLRKYSELKFWNRVALHYGITKKVIQNIRKKHKN